MRAFTTKRRGLGDDGARLVAKQARRERLAFRAVERRVRWDAHRTMRDWRAPEWPAMGAR